MVNGQFLSGCGQGEGQVTGFTQMLCCLRVPVRHGPWLQYQNMISEETLDFSFDCGFPDDTVNLFKV